MMMLSGHIPRWQNNIPGSMLAIIISVELEISIAVNKIIHNLFITGPHHAILEKFYKLGPSTWSSYWCPTDSCQIPVIPVVSGTTITVEFTSQNFRILIFRYLHQNSPWNGTGMHDWNGCKKLPNMASFAYSHKNGKWDTVDMLCAHFQI